MTDEVYKLLYSPRRTQSKIKLKKSQISALVMSMEPSGIRYDTDKAQSSPSDPMLRFIEKKEKLEAELIILMTRYDTELQNLIDAINCLEDPNEVETLTDHYVNGISVEIQARRINYDPSTVYKWQRQGIWHLQENIRQSRQ